MMILVVCLTLSIFTGCDEEQKQQIDRAADFTQQTTEHGEGFLNSPMGQLLVPPDVQGWIRLGGALAIGLATAWKQYRAKTVLTKVTKSIVHGIEASGTDGENCKPLIAQAMKDNEVYRQGKEIVQELKNGSTNEPAREPPAESALPE
ncbi:MAG TPA: hypothetical protein VMW16_03240 [Sedimentisphaerales bacterium]|nr:hypothetical protein [Sedimentisphaerales bacterium]